jgi:hypothetical protein
MNAVSCWRPTLVEDPRPADSQIIARSIPPFPSGAAWIDDAAQDGTAARQDVARGQRAKHHRLRRSCPDATSHGLASVHTDIYERWLLLPPISRISPLAPRRLRTGMLRAGARDWLPRSLILLFTFSARKARALNVNLIIDRGGDTCPIPHGMLSSSAPAPPG